MTVHRSKKGMQQRQQVSLTLREWIRKTRREFSHRGHLTRVTEFTTILDFLDINPGDRICDIGCGDGYWTSKLAPAARHIVGVDPDFLALVRGQKFYGHFVRFVEATAEKLPFASESFEKVVGLCAMEHFTSDDWALQEIYRILSPAGMLALSLDSLSLPSIPEDYRRRHSQRYLCNYLYTHESVQAKLEQAGFELLQHKYLATSVVSDFFIRMQFELGWSVNWLAPISLPMSKIAERLSNRDGCGHILGILAQKRV